MASALFGLERNAEAILARSCEAGRSCYFARGLMQKISRELRLPFPVGIYGR